MNYNKIIQEVIDEHKISPVDMLGIGDTAGEYDYMNNLKGSYIRTVRDIDNLYKTEKDSTRILEIGSFLGPVSISLKRIGYNVSASDIPEFSARLKPLYDKNEIPFYSLNLRHCKLPFESNSFDVVVLCEVFEHLNFNPLPILSEINRVLKNNGYIYIGMPNLSNIRNRIKLLLGKSIHQNPIEDFFKQLDRNDNAVAGVHWREYTMAETVLLIENMGFETFKKYYSSENEEGHANESALQSILKKIVFFYPPFRLSQVVIGRKIRPVSYDFWLTEVNS
jgi:SAM-dependent methyltransferase